MTLLTHIILHSVLESLKCLRGDGPIDLEELVVKQGGIEISSIVDFALITTNLWFRNLDGKFWWFPIRRTRGRRLNQVSNVYQKLFRVHVHLLKLNSRTSLHNGKALVKFKEMMVYQGVDSNIANTLCYGTIEEMWNILLPISIPKTYLKAQTTGFISHIDAQKVGEVCVSLGE